MDNYRLYKRSKSFPGNVNGHLAEQEHVKMPGIKTSYTPLSRTSFKRGQSTGDDVLEQKLEQQRFGDAVARKLQKSTVQAPKIKNTAKSQEREQTKTKATRARSTNIPPLPAINEHANKTKAPLAAKYFKKWRSSDTVESLAKSIETVVIEEECSTQLEEQSQTDMITLDSKCLDLLSRFPSSPEFSTVLHDVLKPNK